MLDELGSWEKDGPIAHMLHAWYIYLQNWVIFLGQMLVNIPAPWSIWVLEDIGTSMKMMVLPSRLSGLML